MSELYNKTSSVSMSDTQNITRQYDNQGLELSEQTSINLYTDFVDKFTYKVDVSKQKNSGLKFIDRFIAIREYPYIKYNTSKQITILQFDIDNVDEGMGYWHKRITEKIGIEPSHTTETTNGIQFGYMLQERLFIKYYKSDNDNLDNTRVRELKKIMAGFIDGIDKRASHKLSGRWRNPFQHNSIMTGKSYSIQELFMRFDVPEDGVLKLDNELTWKEKKDKINTEANRSMEDRKNAVWTDIEGSDMCYNIYECDRGELTIKPSKTNKINDSINEGFHQGNRNNYLFAYGYKLLFDDRSVSLPALLLQENNEYGNKLPENEVKNIVKSISNYESRMYVGKIGGGKPRIRRGKYSDLLYENNIHGEHNRFSAGGHITSIIKRGQTHNDILNAMVKLFEMGKVNPTGVEVSEHTKIGKRQVQRLVKSVSSGVVFGKFVSSLLIDIRAHVVNFFTNIFEGINSTITKSKSGEIITKPYYGVNQVVIYDEVAGAKAAEWVKGLAK